MARYVIADHHFDHGNIIDYCERPFSSTEEMNRTMLDNHHEVVGPDDVTIHLGDVAMGDGKGRKTIQYFRQLGGDVLIPGNHDTLHPDDAPFPVLEQCVLECEGYRFYCTHRPSNSPESWDGWVLHGHKHNNDTENYPFVAYDEQRVNVSCELLDYHPLALSDITNVLEDCTPGTRLRDVSDTQVENQSWQRHI
jgi:calcineurin-like phosphoesterase family protein